MCFLKNINASLNKIHLTSHLSYLAKVRREESYQIGGVYNTSSSISSSLHSLSHSLLFTGIIWILGGEPVKLLLGEGGYLSNVTRSLSLIQIMASPVFQGYVDKLCLSSWTSVKSLIFMSFACSRTPLGLRPESYELFEHYPFHLLVVKFSASGMCLFQ